MKAGYAVSIVAAIGLVVAGAGPLSVAQSTRNVHNTFYNALPPEGVDNPREALASFGSGEYACSINSGGACTESVYVPAHYACGVSDAQLSLRIQNAFPHYQPTTATDPEKQSILVATNVLYVIPEVEGSLAGQVDEVWFEFLETFPLVADDLCNLNLGYGGTGVYLPFYRGDTDPADGWRIPINTFNVPDGVYGALLRAFIDGLPVKTVAIYAIVDNYFVDVPWNGPQTPAACQNQGACGYRDVLPPWPSMYPGDTALSGQTQYVFEYGEFLDWDEPPVASVTRGGTDEYTVGTGLACAVDLNAQGRCGGSFGDGDPVIFTQVTPAEYGTKLVINGVIPQSGDFVCIEGTDLWGNQARKCVTVG